MIKRLFPVYGNSTTTRRVPRYAMPGVNIYVGDVLVRTAIASAQRMPIRFEVERVAGES